MVDRRFVNGRMIETATLPPTARPVLPPGVLTWRRPVWGDVCVVDVLRSDA